ncbi:MAG TPA: amidohydrolase family protein [Caulobacteraceae bacterium]|nr:amidohydrolase family protein [Caulobacteraceae bacterium]
MSQDQHLGRRELLVGAAAASALAAAGSAGARTQAHDPLPVVDSHIHLFDGSRPQGAPYLGSKAYRAQSHISLPAGYAPLAKPTGIVGAVVVEASSWVEDNLWLLEVAQANPIILGVVGNLNPSKPEFAEYLGRFRKNPLYRGIRFSRFYTGKGADVALDPDMTARLRLLAEADLTLDNANPTMDLLKANLLLSQAIPELRIVADHVPSFDPTPEVMPAYEDLIKRLADRPNIFVKLTEVYHPRDDNGLIVKDYEPLRARLEYLYGAFGEDRVMFGTDYPNSYGVATIPEEVGLMKRFFATKSREAAEKYFWKNSAKIYKWKKRTDKQPSLA